MVFGLIKKHTVLGQTTLRDLQANHLSRFVKQQQKRTLDQDVKQQWRLTAAKLSSNRSVFALWQISLKFSDRGL